MSRESGLLRDSAARLSAVLDILILSAPLAQDLRDGGASKVRSRTLAVPYAVRRWLSVIVWFVTTTAPSLITWSFSGRVPMMASRTVETLRAFGGSVEGRYTLIPGLYVAARADHLAFNRVQGALMRLPWEAPVTRLEVGGGYYLLRNVIVRSSLQVNHRDAGRVTRSRLLAGQLLVWF